MNQAKKKIIADTYVKRMLLVLVAIIILGSVMRPSVFPTFRTAEAAMRQAVEYGLLALGVSICMMSGGIDLSAIYLANLCSIILGYILKNYYESMGMTAIVLGVIFVILIGGLGGLLNGFLIGKLKLPAMLATLGSGQLFMGISLVITRGKSLNDVPAFFSSFASAQILGIPLIFIVFLVCVILLYWFMDRTRYGMEIYLVGSNMNASVFSGLKDVVILIRAYVISGLLAALSGIVILSRNNSAKADFGSSYLLLTILIAVLGGTNPDGGSGSIRAVGIAVVIMQLISSLFNMFGAAINTFYRNIIWGLLLLITLVVNYYLEKKK